MTALLIVGAGGHGRVLADAALTMGNWGSICFVDDRPGTRDTLGFPVVGTCEDLERLAKSYSQAAVGIGDARVRLELIERCRLAGFNLPAVVHRTAAVSRYASLGQAVAVFAQAAVNPRAVLADGCIVNTGATVDHDCDLACGVHICPGAHLAGDVRIGPRAWIGIGSSVKQGTTIGADAVIGAGAAVVSNIDPGLVVTGVPARSRRSHP